MTIPLTRKSAGQLPGTSTNDNAAAGHVGEVMSASLAQASATGLVTATAKTVCGPITLTAGDWEVSAMLAFNPHSATSWTNIIASVSVATNTLSGNASIGVPTSGGECRIALALAAGVHSSTTPCLVIPSYRVTVVEGATLPLYLVAYSTFTINTMAANGYIQARRMR